MDVSSTTSICVCARRQLCWLAQSCLLLKPSSPSTSLAIQCCLSKRADKNNQQTSTCRTTLITFGYNSSTRIIMIIALILILLIFNVRCISARPDDFLFAPTVIHKQTELVADVGSNITLACQARGSPPLTFVWFQDEKNLTSPFSNGSEQPASTKLLEERRYEIAEDIKPNITISLLYLYDLQLSDTSLFLCWVENSVGYSHANFSLIVNNPPPTAKLKNPSSFLRANNFIGLRAGEAQVVIVSIAFIVLLAAAIIFLLISKYTPRSSKSSRSDNTKPSKSPPEIISESRMATGATASANEKFINQNHQHSMFVDDYDDSDDDSSDNSTSSCRNYDGFIEHMRTGIINIDYHSMSPVGQFNNTINTHPMNPVGQFNNSIKDPSMSPVGQFNNTIKDPSMNPVGQYNNSIIDHSMYPVSQFNNSINTHTMNPVSQYNNTINTHPMNPVGQFNSSIKDHNNIVQQQLHQQTMQEANQRFIMAKLSHPSNNLYSVRNTPWERQEF